MLLWSLACKPSSQTLTVLHSNDIHGIYKPYKIKVGGKLRFVGGMEAASHYIRKIREQTKNSLLIDTGDLMTGTLAAQLKYKGVTGGVIPEFLNLLGYDIRCYGNHSFDMGLENALGLERLTRFPVIMANIVHKDNGTLFSSAPYHIFDKDGLKIGVIAVMEENFLLEVYKDHVKDLDVLPVILTLNSYMGELDKKTDLVIVLVHSQFHEGERVARDVPGIDVVLVASDDGRFKVVDGVLVKSTFGKLKTLGCLKLRVKHDRVVDFEEDLVWLWADIPLELSPEIKQFVRETDQSVETEYAQIIGTAEMDLWSRGGQVESPMGNWITDVMRWKTGAQIGFHNSGGIRANILEGPVSKKNIFEVSPFHNFLVVFELTGQQLKDVLEHDVERDSDRLQVSGLRYKFFSKEARSLGRRISSVEVNGEFVVRNGQVLLPEKVFLVVSNDYVLSQANDKYFGFSVDEYQATWLPLNQVLMEWMQEHKVLSYRVEDRIVKLM